MFCCIQLISVLQLHLFATSVISGGGVRQSGSKAAAVFQPGSDEKKSCNDEGQQILIRNAAKRGNLPRLTMS